MKTKKYTREQLVKGMEKYYKECNEKPESFSSDITDCEQSSKETIDYLLNIIDNEN